MLIKKKQINFLIPKSATSFGNNRAQTMLEYLSLLGIVAAVVIAMATYVGRGVQGLVRLVADQVGNQQQADQRRSQAIDAQEEGSGYVMSSAVRTDLTLDKGLQQDLEIYNYTFNDRTASNSQTLTNLGFRKRVSP